MITRIRCDKPSFREVKFNPDFNVILANRTETSTDRDSRNGLGKTTLVEIIHYCFGSDLKKSPTLKKSEVDGWQFTVDFEVDGRNYSVTRSTEAYGVVELEGDFSEWSIRKSPEESGPLVLKNNEWKHLLSQMLFGFNPDEYEIKYKPKFRSLFSFIVRREHAFQDAFRHFRQQATWDKQAHIAFLLGLNWKIASEIQIIRDSRDALKALQNAAAQGHLEGFLGTIGELETDRVRLEKDVAALEKQLASFKVHPQYEDIRTAATKLTDEIHDLSNQSMHNDLLISKYRQSLDEERDVSVDEVNEIYKSAGLVFSESITKTLDEVTQFHQIVLENRRNYLESEISRLVLEIKDLDGQIESKSNQRAGHLKVLQTHGALDEFTELQNRLATFRQQLGDVKSTIRNLQEIKIKLSSL
ncbi:MAG: DUF2326 domain-containing protein, partial [Candidatus Thorarchaeota archaeon]